MKTIYITHKKRIILAFSVILCLAIGVFLYLTLKTDKPKEQTDAPAVTTVTSEEGVPALITATPTGEKQAFGVFDQKAAEEFIGTGATRITDMDTAATIKEGANVTAARYQKDSQVVTVRLYKYKDTETAKTNQKALESSDTKLSQKNEYIITTQYMDGTKFDGDKSQQILSVVTGKF